MRSPTNRRKTSPTRTAVRGLLIVARDQVELYRTLQDQFGDSLGVSILLDRRKEERRRGQLVGTAERRRTERRSLPRIEDDPSLRHYALVRPHYRRPRD